MSSSILATLVGNDSNRVEEFVCVFANILKSFLVALHEEGKMNLTTMKIRPQHLNRIAFCMYFFMNISAFYSVFIVNKFTGYIDIVTAPGTIIVLI